MRKLSTMLCAAVAAAGLFGVSNAQAGISAAWVPVGAPKTTLVDAGVTSGGTLIGYTAYILRISSSSGGISAVDFGGFSTTKTAGSVNGAMLQTWADDGGGGTGIPSPVFTQNNSTVNSSNLDSHFLPSAATITWQNSDTSVTPNVAMPLENNNGTDGGSNGNPLSNKNQGAGTGPFYGLGNFLSGFGPCTNTTLTTLDVAYVVIPNSVDINTMSPTNAQVSTQTNGAFVVQFGAVPEPASIGVLALGGLALLARRRKA